MATPPLTDAQCIEAIEAKALLGTSKAADKLGLSPGSFANRVRVGVQRNLDGHFPGKIRDGFQIHSENQSLDKHGNVSGHSVKTIPQTNHDAAMREGFEVARESMRVGPNGEHLGGWLITKPGERSPEYNVKVIKEAFENFTPKAPMIAKSKGNNKDMLTAYILTDWHYGLFAYGKETGGPDWDLSIADKVLRTTIGELVDQSPKSENAIILGLGDLLHADDVKNQTARSANTLDVDTRHSKCLGGVCDLLAETVEAIATKHGNVLATFKPGNHDENSTVGISQALRMYWRESKRVQVDVSPDPFFWHRFGVNLIGGVHGDRAKIKDLPLIMANRRAQDWSETKTRHVHTGHIHHETAKEDGGVTVYSHRAPVAQDAYHAAHGYLSGRSMKAFNYHKTRGSRGSTEIEIYDEG